MEDVSWKTGLLKGSKERIFVQEFYFFSFATVSIERTSNQPENNSPEDNIAYCRDFYTIWRAK